MPDPFDYSACTLDELHDARAHIDRVAHPERAAEIDSWIQIRTADAKNAEPSLPPSGAEKPARSRAMSFLAGCGVVSLVLVLLLAVFISVIAFRGRDLDHASRKVAVEVVNAVTQTWAPEPLLANATTELRAKLSDEAVHRLFGLYRKLGVRTELGEPAGEAKMTAGFGRFVSGVTAEYAFPAKFAAGPARIRISLVREADVWRVTGFWVDSEALLAPAH